MTVKKHISSDLKKFLLVASVLVAYCAFAVYSYGIAQGLSVTALTWSFFVFCTPIADAGFLLDFPIRLVTGFRMVHSEVVVWMVAALLNLTFFLLSPNTYQNTELLRLFYAIIATPWPLGLIIVLSAIGTFASVVFDDSIFDAARTKKNAKHAHLNKKKLYTTISVFVLTFCLYALLLHIEHISIKFF